MGPDDAGGAGKRKLAVFRDTLLCHRRFTVDGVTEETVLDLSGSGLEIMPGDFIGLHAGGVGAYRFYHELGAWLQGLRKPADGELRLFDRDAPLSPEWSARTARVFREGGALPDLTVRDNVDVALTFSGLSRTDRAGRVEEALERFALTGYRDAFPGTDDVGRGAEKRLNYARAWARRPLLLFIDQPFLHVRDRYASMAVEAVNELVAMGGAVVFTSNREHDLRPGIGGRESWRPNRCFTLQQGRLSDF